MRSKFSRNEYFSQGSPQLVALCFALLANTCFSQTAPKEWNYQPRHVMAIWDSKNDKRLDYTSTWLHKKIESIFHHQGLVLDYIDEKLWPKEKLENKDFLERELGIVSWFKGPEIIHPQKYLDWLNNQIKNKKKFLLLGQLGVQPGIHKNITYKFLNEKLKSFGLEFGERFYEKPLFHRVKKIDDKMMNFERGLTGEIPFYDQTFSINPKNKVHLQIETVDETDSSGDLVWTGPSGGYAQEAYEIFENPENYKTEWRINPFKFIKDSLNLPKFPIPDTTTLNGHRIFYGHIDGDGFISQSHIDNKSSCGKIILDKILKKYQLPMTVSLVVAELDPKIVGKSAQIETAKEIFALNYIETASHTYSHPLSWNLVPTADEIENYVGKGKKHSGPILAYPIKNYELNFKQEVVGAIQWLNKNVAPVNKPVKIVLWSGTCRPGFEAMEISENSGYMNFNGGDPRFDSRYPSYSHLAPLFRKVGPFMQVYTSNSNENVYTNFWLGPFSGQREVIETLKNTESPRRINPINIYFHFYSGEQISSVKALQEVFDYVKMQEPIPIHVSDYIKIVKGFESTQIFYRGKNDFKITHNNDLRTFRFDDETRFPDYTKSENVIGHNFYQNSLYLYLGNKTQTIISLSEKTPKIPFLLKANALIDEFKSTDLSLIIRGKNYTPAKIVIANLRVEYKYLINSKVWIKTNHHGNLAVEVEKTGPFDIKIDLPRTK